MTRLDSRAGQDIDMDSDSDRATGTDMDTDIDMNMDVDTCTYANQLYEYVAMSDRWIAFWHGSQKEKMSKNKVK
ncbi:GL27351 [Drosophila persimilis]|uniref:GL27351 n=1 Tax=Drosophila persimilis TaxID=7234 RepID=B4GZF0_DROPE|nr:GL27351 [Drosophila persimilis]